MPSRRVAQERRRARVGGLESAVRTVKRRTCQGVASERWGDKGRGVRGNGRRGDRNLSGSLLTGLPGRRKRGGIPAKEAVGIGREEYRGKKGGEEKERRTAKHDHRPKRRR